MKKVLVAILTMLYLLSSSGATVRFHYCFGRLADWSLTAEKPDKCSKCGMKSDKQKKCCKEESKQYKLDDTLKANAQHQDFSQLAVVLPLVESALPVSAVKDLARRSYFSNAPPERICTDRVLLNQNFRI